MPAFTAVGAYVAGTVLGLVGTAATIVGAIVATGAAYITSRVINGNPNKGNNSAASQGGRIQVPPATNNKIPVVYGNAYVNGIITDARLISLENKINDRMYYCIVLSEYTNNLINPVFSLESAYWNDLRLTALDATTNAHIVKDGRKVVDGAIVTAGSFVVGKTYIITKLGTTTQANWNTIAGTSGKIYAIGSIFTCANAGTGDGQAQEEDFIDTNFIIGTNQYVQMRVYAGGSGASNQIYPAQSTGNTANAYNFWGSGPQNPDGDGSWDSTYQMDGLVFAIVSVRYNGEKGFTGLPNMTFQLANNVSNPADVWKDYMTSERYGAGIPSAQLDETARLAWYNFCEEDINYTNVAGEANQALLRYSINGVIDTANPVKTNIDTIVQNGGAWLSYDVATGLWSPIIKKAVSAGEPGDSATYFTASRSSSTLTVTSFPNGRIEAGQRLYDSNNNYIGTITAQLAPTTGETAGQIGRYTTSSSGSISLTTFYTLPASSLEFSDDNIISGINISSTRLDDLYNSVEVEFYNKYNKDQKSYYRTSLDSADRNPNEPDNQLRMNLDLCNNSIQADLIGQLELRQSRDDLVIEFTTTHYGIQTQAGDVIAVTSELYDWAPKYFRVMRVKEQETEEGGLIAQIQALEYNPDVYTIEPITEFSTSSNIGIGVYGASPNLPQPPVLRITQINADKPVPNLQLQIEVPAAGGPYDEIEMYYTEGWDPFNITGSITGSTATITATDYGAINVGDFFTIGSTNFTITAQLTNSPASKTFASGGAVAANTVTLNNTTGLIIGNNLLGTGLPTTGAHIIAISGSEVTLDTPFVAQAAGTYTVEGGLGTYSLDTSVASPVSGTTLLYDRPVESDYAYLKKIVPEGNNGTFTNGETITTIITEVPANTQLYRRWFVKARMGIKKRFGSFSTPSDSNLDGNFQYEPNPVASGTLGDLSDVDVATKAEGDILYYDATTSKWRNTPILSIDDTGDIGITVNSKKNNQLNTESGLTNAPTAPLVLRHTSSGTPAAGFGTTLGFETETPGSGVKTAGYIDFQMTDATTGSEDFQFGVGLMKAGVEPSPTLLRPLTLTNNGDLTLTGTGQFITFSTQPQGVNTMYGIRGMSALDDPWFVGSGSVGNDQGYLEIATGDNTNGSATGGQIYVRQYNGEGNGGAPWYGGNGTVQNELILLDNVGDTTIPNNLTVDSGTLFVDAANNRVGINDLTPSYTLDVNGTANVEIGLTVPSISTLTGDDLTITAFSGRDVTLSTSLAADPVTLVRTTANTNASTRSLTLRVESTGTPAAGLTNTLEYEMETAPGVVKTIGYVDISSTSLTSGSETFEMNFGLRNGASYPTLMSLDHLGNLQIDGDLTVSGNDIKSSSATALTLSGSDVTVVGDLTVSGNDIKSSSATAITMSGADVSVLGDLTVSGNDIKSSGGTTAITLSGATVSMPSDLTVDSGTLKVDATNNRVGVNNATPTVALDVVGGIKATLDIQADSITATNRIDTDGILELYSTGFGSAGFENQAIYYTATGNSIQTADQWSTLTYRTAKYTISMRKGTDYQCIELMILHDGTTAYMTQYNEIFTNASLATFTVDINTSNVRLRVTPATVGSLEMNIERKLFVII